MIDEIDVKRAIVDRLADNGYNVVSPDSEEGFDKPALTVLVSKHERQRFNALVERNKIEYEIDYFPLDETVESCMDEAVTISELLLSEPLAVADRRLCVHDLSYDVENSLLFINFEIEFYQVIKNNDDEDDVLKELTLNGRKIVE